MLSLQEMFDKALFGVRAQGRKSVNADGACAYRGASFLADQRLACGVGHLIPDEAYDPVLDKCEIEGDGVAVSCLLAPFNVDITDDQRNAFKHAMSATGVDLGDQKVREFLIELQDAHDSVFENGHFIRGFNESMRRLAERYKLTYTPPTA